MKSFKEYTELNEAKEISPEEFDGYIENFLQGFKSKTSLKKVLASKYSKLFRDMYSKKVFRSWNVSQTIARKIQGRYVKGKFVKPESVKIKYKLPFISYSWSKNGAEQVSEDDRFGANTVTIIVEINSLKQDDILINLAQYGKESFNKLKVKNIEANLLATEQEVVLKNNSSFSTINPKSVIFMSEVD